MLVKPAKYSSVCNVGRLSRRVNAEDRIPCGTATLRLRPKPAERARTNRARGFIGLNPQAETAHR